MDESHGSRGERIAEWNLSYRLGDLSQWLYTHHSPLSNWVPILCSSDWRSGRRSSVDAQMTTDTVKDVRSIDSECGSPAAVGDGDDSNADSSPLALLVPLVNARRRGAGPCSDPTAPAMAVPGGRAPVTSLMSGRAWMRRRRLADGHRPSQRPGMAGQGTARGPGDSWQQQRVRAARAAASPGWPPPTDIIAAR